MIPTYIAPSGMQNKVSSNVDIAPLHHVAHWFPRLIFQWPLTMAKIASPDIPQILSNPSSKNVWNSLAKMCSEVVVAWKSCTPSIFTIEISQNHETIFQMGRQGRCDMHLVFADIVPLRHGRPTLKTGSKLFPKKLNRKNPEVKTLSQFQAFLVAVKWTDRTAMWCLFLWFSTSLAQIPYCQHFALTSAGYRQRIPAWIPYGNKWLSTGSIHG